MTSEHGRSGTVVFRQLLDARGARYVAPESELEARFVELVQRYGLARPARQVDMGDADSWIGRIDFVYRDARVLVEVDGQLGHSSHLDVVADAERDRRLGAVGWKVLRFDWDVVTRRPERVAETVRAALAGQPTVPRHETGRWSNHFVT